MRCERPAATISQAIDRASRADEYAHEPLANRRFSQPERLLVAHASRLDADLLVDLVAWRSDTIPLSPDERDALLGYVRHLAPTGAFDMPYVILAWRACLLE